jgi:hypothetical protein
MDVFPEPTGLTAVLPGEERPVRVEEPRRDALLIGLVAGDGFMKSEPWLMPLLTPNRSTS